VKQPEARQLGRGRDLYGRRKDGSEFPVDIGLNPVETSHGTFILSCVIDITERKQTLEALHESEERFRNMADSAPVALWLADHDGLATFFNKSALSFTGLTMAQLAGTKWTTLVHPDERQDCESAYLSALADRRSFRIECRVLRADGEYRWVSCSGVPRFSPDGQFIGYVGTTVDVTHFKRVHEAALARQKMESLGLLASGIAHDFNNLLGGILAQAELIEAGLPRPVQREDVERIKTAAVRGGDIVRELMIYSGRDTKDFAPVDLSRLVQEMLELLKVSISKRATLKTDLAENLPALWGSAPQLRQVIMNLVINASEAIGQDLGEIHVTTARIASDESRSLRRAMELSEGDYVFLEVSDTGSGMTEKQRTRIFEPFFTTKFNGRGLGLAVVQGIIQSHGGVIRVTSTPGLGSTFQVFLPCSTQTQDAEEKRKHIVSNEPKSLAGRTVLVVEDEDSLRYALAQMLKMKGVSILEAADGSVAIDRLQNRKYTIDLTLLDLTVPGAASRKVIEEARRIRPDMKLVVMSAHSLESAEHSLKMQISAFIRKPFPFNDLLQVLRETLP
jgi:PAS domain S-box-containing protein